jgi:hypothetical protein
MNFNYVGGCVYLSAANKKIHFDPSMKVEIYIQSNTSVLRLNVLIP